MDRPPKRADETFFSGGGGLRVAVGGIMFAAATLSAYAVGNTLGYKEACTMAYLVLSLSQLAFVPEMRNRTCIFKGGITRFMVVSLLVSAAMVFVVAFVPPLQRVFGLTALPPAMYLAALGLSLVPTAFHALCRWLGVGRKFRKLFKSEG